MRMSNLSLIDLMQASNKRFQRLESHVVTLARSVAHLSSEMRTQHIMIQEMETIRKEMAQLRANPLRQSASSNPYAAGCRSGARGFRVDRDTCWQGAVPALTDPSRVKKLTSFFGDEPPLLRIFLKKLGYEVHPSIHPISSIHLLTCLIIRIFKYRNTRRYSTRRKWG